MRSAIICQLHKIRGIITLHIYMCVFVCACVCMCVFVYKYVYTCMYVCYRFTPKIMCV